LDEPTRGRRPGGLSYTCRDIEQRATQTLHWAVQNKMSLLTLALDHLTIGRSRFYRTILERLHASGVLVKSAVEDSKPEIVEAVEGLRRAGDVTRLPRGLLTRAWLRFLTGDAVGARADLDEVWEIAERGPMPLFQADVQLYRARLFKDKEALVEARRLIEKYRYGRRLEELADAEEASAGW
jgi:hypothetical protein